MKIRVERRQLADALSWGAGHLAAKPTIPARAGLLLDASDDTLTVSGADWSVTTRSTLDADVMAPGRIVIPGKLAAQVVASYRAEFVELAVESDQRAELTAGRDRFQFTLLPVGDYPAVGGAPAADGTVDGDAFRQVVRQVAIATDPDTPAEPWRGAVQLTATDGRLVAWASDRYRLAERTTPWTAADGATGPVEALVPAKALADAMKGLEGDLWLSLTGGTAAIGSDTRYITLARVDETSRKDPHQVLPTEWPTEAVVTVGELVAAVKRACLVAGDRKPKVLLGFGVEEISVRAAGDDTGAAAFGIVDASIQGPAVQIAFTPALLLDALQTAHTDQVRIGASEPRRPILVRAHGDDSDWMHLVMPVQL